MISVVNAKSASCVFSMTPSIATPAASTIIESIIYGIPLFIVPSALRSMLKPLKGHFPPLQTPGVGSRVHPLLLPRLDAGSTARQTRDRYNGIDVARVVKKLAHAPAWTLPGIPGTHCGRARHKAAIGGASERSIMNQTGHRSVQIVRRYIRDGGPFRENSAGKLGL